MADVRSGTILPVLSDFSSFDGTPLYVNRTTGRGYVLNSVDGIVPIVADWMPGMLFNVIDYGADPTGAADSTTAFQDCLAAAGANSRIDVPAGTYLITSTILIAQDRVHLIGAGQYATTILFAPTTDDTCLELNAGGGILTQGSVSNLTFFSDDATYTKIAIDLVDSSGYRLENIAISGSVVHASTVFWGGGAGSIGLRTRGREFAQIRDFYCSADRPLVIATNPNNNISIDHFHFTDQLLFAYAHPCVEIEDGVNLSNVQFDGANAWVGGTYGLYWSDTTTSIVSNNLGIRGVRTEQGTDATAYSFYISHNYVLENLHIEDSYPDALRRGFYLRKVKNTLIETTSYGGTLEAFNFVAISGQLLTFQNCFFQVGGTAVLTNFYLYDAMPDIEANKPIPNSAVYIYATGYQANQRRRLPIITTANLPAAGTVEDGSAIIEDAGAGDRNLILYAGGQRFRIDGGANV